MSEINEFNITNVYALLCQMVEEALHRRMHTPKDFEHLSEALFERTHVLISVATLKRFWGYVKSDHAPSANTLDALAMFVGYPDFDAFYRQLPESGELPSNPVVSRHVNVLEDLSDGDRLTIYWAPNRVCHVCYLGKMMFRVMTSENTRLEPGNTFSCALMIEGEPLYLSQLVQEDRPPVNYVCGKKGGIRLDIEGNGR